MKLLEFEEEIWKFCWGMLVLCVRDVYVMNVTVRLAIQRHFQITASLRFLPLRIVEIQLNCVAMGLIPQLDFYNPER
jgi:hypothetical protein